MATALKYSGMLCLFAMLGAGANAASILFSNLVQPGNQYGPDGVSIGHTPSFPTAGDYLTYAVHFVPSATATVTSFDVPLGVVSGTNQLTAFLMSDAAGAPGVVLETFALSNLPAPPGFPSPLLTINSTLHPTIAAGQQYWFAVTGGPETFGIWSQNLLQGDPADGGASQSFIGGVPQSWIVGSGSRTGALQVSGDAVPEPSYTWLLGGIIACFGLGRRRAAARQRESARSASAHSYSIN